MASRWYLQIGTEQARSRGLYKKSADPSERTDYLRAARERRRLTLTANVKELRKVFTGFDAASGYDLHDIKSWPARRASEIDKHAEYLHHLKSQPHSVLRPRNEKQKTALVLTSGQRLKRQKAYIIHKPSDKDMVTIDRNGVISISRDLGKRGRLQDDYYFFEVFLKQPDEEWVTPDSWEDIYALTGEILSFMPSGMYYIFSSLHGEIDAPQHRHMLPRVIMRYMQEYSQKDFARTILGFKKLSDDTNASTSYQSRFDQRRKYKEQKEKDRREFMRRATSTKRKR